MDHRKKNFKLSYLLYLISIISFFFNSAYIKTVSAETPIEIENPIFTTIGVNEMPYTLKAASGIQKGNDLELFEIEGKIKNRNGMWVYLNADKGNYNQVSGVVFLFNNIVVYTDNKQKLFADEAIIDMNQDIITLLSNVEYQNERNKIKADKSIITDNFQKIKYFGNVKTEIKKN